jgi:tetratricopeptide (TPR) repeat protein
LWVWGTVPRSPVPETQLNHVLRAAIGWYELGLAAEALAELDALLPPNRDRTESLELRAVILQQMERWEEAAQTYAQLCSRPEAPVDRFIAWGCCLFELNRVKECRSALLAAPPEARRHGLWNFHLACYEALLGNRNEARRLVQECLQLDPRLRRMATQNENLAPLLD